MTILDYNVESMIIDLQKIMRIQDIDIFYFLKDNKGMERKTGSIDSLGYCEVHRTRNIAFIFINTELDENNDSWFETLIHELYHVVTDPLSFHTEGLTEQLRDKQAVEYKQKETETRIESLVEKLSQIFVNAIGEDFKEKYRIKDVDSNERK
jgi:Zn-dependent peptidase ImmA (M78 family)